jgi:tetratricopeptide (TPR) repeat protein
VLRIIIIFIIISSFTSCKKPYGQDPMVREDFPDSLNYPQITEIEDDDDAFQYYRLAKLKYSQKKYDEGIGYAREAIDLDEQNAIFYYMLAQLLAAQDKPEEALDNALKAYSLGYLNPDLQVLIAQQYYKIGEASEGERYLDVALKKRPENPNTTFLRAVIYLQNQDTTRGMAWLNETIEIDSSFGEAYRRKAEILIARDSIEKAISQLERAYSINPLSEEDMYTIATLNMKTGNLKEATLWLRRLIMLDNSNISAYLQLAQIKLDQRQYDSARYYAQHALDYNEHFNDARLLIARSYDRQYRYSQALEVYRDIVARDPDFDIAAIEMELLEKKIAYLRRRRQQQDSIKNNAPAPVDTTNNSDS